MQSYEFKIEDFNRKAFKIEDFNESSVLSKSKILTSVLQRRGDEILLKRILTFALR